MLGETVPHTDVSEAWLNQNAMQMRLMQFVCDNEDQNRSKGLWKKVKSICAIDVKKATLPARPKKSRSPKILWIWQPRLGKNKTSPLSSGSKSELSTVTLRDFNKAIQIYLPTGYWSMPELFNNVDQKWQAYYKYLRIISWMGYVISKKLSRQFLTSV